MKKRELEKRIERLERDVWGKQRFVGGGVGILARLEKLEGGAFELNRRLPQVEGDMRGTQSKVAELKGIVGEELPRLFTRIEELERVRIELEAALIRVEGDKARQPEQWNKEHSCHTDCPCQTGGEPPSDFVEARQPDEGERGATPEQPITGPSYQPDEPMADMPETGPSNWTRWVPHYRPIIWDGKPLMLPVEQDDLTGGTGPEFVRAADFDRLVTERETGPSDYKHSPGPLERVAAERDQARAERNQLREEVRLLKSERDEARTARDGVEQYWDRKYAATRDMCAEYRAELDRLREAAGKLASEVASAIMKTEPQPGVYQYTATGSFSEIYEAAADLRALLDGEKEQT